MTASIPLSDYVYNNEHFVLYIEYHWKNNKAIITFGWIYFMGYVEQSVQEVVRWKCGMREKTIQPRCARGTAPLSAAFAASFTDGQVKTFRHHSMPLISLSFKYVYRK